MKIDPNSSKARDKLAALLNRMNAEARALLEQASYLRKTNEAVRAIGPLQQVLDLMQPGDEVRQEAEKQMEAIRK